MSRQFIYPGKRNIMLKKLLHTGKLDSNVFDEGEEINSRVRTNAEIPVNDADAEATAKVISIYQEIDAQIEQKKKQDQVEFVCQEGCCSCCRDYFYVSRAEFLLIMDFCKRSCGSLPPQVLEKSLKAEQQLKIAYPKEHRKLSSPQVGLDAFDDQMVPDGFSACPFLEEKHCLVYPVRPIICRLFGVSRSYAPCEKVVQTCQTNGAVDPWKVKKYTVDVPYLDEYKIGIDYAVTSKGTVLLKPYPLFWWAAHFKEGK